MIDLDASFFIQFVIFLFTLVALNAILIRPIRDILAKRADHVASQMGSIEGFTQTSQTKLANYQAALDTARAEAVATRDAARAAAGSEEKAILERAGADVADAMKKARAAIADEAAKAKSEMMGKVQAFASMAVAKVLR